MILWLCKSIGMAFDHLYKYPEVDVVTAANNIKKLLTLALTTSQGLSMFVHPVGRSLLIDNFDIHKWLLNPQVRRKPRTSKGQLISECPFDVLNFPKKQLKNLMNFSPRI